VLSRLQVMVPSKPFSPNQSRSGHQKKIVPCGVRPLFECLTNSWHFWLSYDPGRDCLHQPSHFQRALFVPAITLLVQVVPMLVDPRMIFTCVRRQNNLPAFADVWLAHDPTNQPRTLLSMTHVTACSLITTQIKFRLFGHCIEVVNDGAMCAVAFAGRVVAILSSLRRQVVVTHLDGLFNLKPSCVICAVGNSWFMC
jgi:hypothetical protein